MVGDTVAGDPVFDVRGVRLVLRDHAAFFNRLVPCASCGRETPGSAVRAPTDLDLRPGPVTCTECRRATGEAAAPAPPVSAVEASSDRRLDALEARIERLEADLHAASEQVTTAEREARLEHELEEVRGAAAASATQIEGRVGAVEARADRTATEMAELGDLHAALDAGLGQLRSEIGAIRDGQRGLSMVQDEFDRRLETVAAVHRALTADEGKGRRGGKRSAEVTAQLAAARVAIDELATEHKQLRSQLSVIELAADRAAETAAKAWSQVSAVVPLRMELDALEERLDLQNDALAALTETVHSLLRTAPPTPPAAKTAPRTTKR